MRIINTTLLGLAAVAFAATATFAAMPDELKGSWIVDAAATEAHLKSLPEWKEEDAASLPLVMKRMSQVLYEFKDDTFVMSMRDKRQSFLVILKETREKQHVLEATIGAKVVTLTVTFVDDATIIIRSSASNDMDHFLWKRGSLPGAG